DNDRHAPPHLVADVRGAPHSPRSRPDGRARREQHRLLVVRDERKKISVVLVGPSMDILGGQAVQVTRLLRRLRELEGFDVEFLAVNPRLPGFLRVLQRIKYVRTVVTSIAYL